MTRQQLIELLVLDVMADDYEALEQIHQSLARSSSECGVTISADEIEEILKALIEGGFVKAYRFAEKPDSEIEVSSVRGVIMEIDHQNEIVTIRQHKFAEYEPPTFTYVVKNPKVFSRLRVGQKVHALIFCQHSSRWIVDAHEDDSAEIRTFGVDSHWNITEVAGVPDQEEISRVQYGLTSSGRLIQSESEYPYDDNGGIRPDWKLEE